MNTKIVLGLGVATIAVVTMAVLGLGLAWTLWGRHVWSAGSLAGPGGMMSPMSSWRGGAWGGCESDIGPAIIEGSLSIDDAVDVVEGYISSGGYADLEIAEVMEFEENFHAIVREHDTGIGAMELLVDKRTGAVSPEMGPNMMWNGRHGMRGGRGMMGRSSATNTISEGEALEIAQRWLDAHRPGTVTEEHADPFYGYYTIHTMADDQIEGMLSVHGATGQVWYHTWHGPFIQMLEMEDDH